MTRLFFAALFLASPFLSSAADKARAATSQEGRLSTVSLVGFKRMQLPEHGVNDGMRFLVLVRPKPDVTGKFTLKETRDFLLAGKSYQEKTKAELGKNFEPVTVFDTAEKVVARQADARALVQGDIKGAYLLSIAIVGAKIPDGAPVEVKVEVGYEKEVEPFTFQITAPPATPAKKI